MNISKKEAKFLWHILHHYNGFLYTNARYTHKADMFDKEIEKIERIRTNIEKELKLFK